MINHQQKPQIPTRLIPYFIAFIFLLILCAFAAYIYVGARIFTSLDGCKPAVAVENTDTGQQYSVGCGR